MAMSQAGRGGRRTSDFGFPSARSTVGRRSGSPPKQRPSGLFGGDAAYNTANSPPVGRVPSHGDRFAESLLPGGYPLTPKSAIESHLGFAESFRVHEPIPASQFAAVAAMPPRNNSLRYIEHGVWAGVALAGEGLNGLSGEFPVYNRFGALCSACVPLRQFIPLVNGRLTPARRRRVAPVIRFMTTSSLAPAQWAQTEFALTGLGRPGGCLG
jgi:hypothetical protein